MLDCIRQHRTELSSICRHYHVRRLELFGSAARADFDPSSSDLDFLVEFAPDHPLGGLEAYFGLKEALEKLLARQIDLIAEGAVKNPYVRQSIDGSRETVYAA
jgi:predicted nucleotidyltransferase